MAGQGGNGTEDASQSTALTNAALSLGDSPPKKLQKLLLDGSVDLQSLKAAFRDMLLEYAVLNGKLSHFEKTISKTWKKRITD